MRTLLNIIGIIVIVFIWLILLLHPIVIAFHMHNPIWLFLYLLILPETLVCILFSKVISIITLLEQ